MQGSELVRGEGMRMSSVRETVAGKRSISASGAERAAPRETRSRNKPELIRYSALFYTTVFSSINYCIGNSDERRLTKELCIHLRSRK